MGGLSNGTTYRFQARAKNLIGGGQPTRYIEITPRVAGATVPGRLRDFEVTPVGADFLLEVTPPLDDGCSPIFKYQYRIGDAGDWIDFPEGEEAVRVEDPGTDTTYSFYARACNSIGPGPEIGPVIVSLTVPDVGKPAIVTPPMPLALETDSGIGKVALFWENPFSRYQNHRITRVYRAEANDITQAIEIGTSSSISYIDEDVTGDTTYWYWIRWESTALVLGPSSEAAEATPSESPATIIRRKSQEILGSPLAQELLSPVNTDLAGNSEVTRRILEKVAAVRALLADEAHTIQEGDARATAIQELRSEITTTIDGRVTVINELLTALEVRLNDRRASAVNLLRTEINEGIRNQITILTESITALEVSFGGRTLGPPRNMFAAPASNDTKAGAEAARNTYAASNSSWLAQYDADNDINIEISWSIYYLYQRRVNRVWVDNGEPLVHASAVTTLTARIDVVDRTITSLAQSITELMVNLEGLTVSAFESLEVRVTQTENLEGGTTLAGLARWTVKLRVGDRVAGIGLVNNGGMTQLLVNADRFAILNPDDTNISDGIVPFFVEGGKVYLDIALIRDATIDVAKIGRAFLDNLTAVHGKLRSALIDKGNIFDLSIQNVCLLYTSPSPRDS